MIFRDCVALIICMIRFPPGFQICCKTIIVTVEGWNLYNRSLFQRQQSDESDEDGWFANMALKRCFFFSFFRLNTPESVGDPTGPFRTSMCIMSLGRATDLVFGADTSLFQFQWQLFFYCVQTESCTFSGGRSYEIVFSSLPNKNENVPLEFLAIISFVDL